MKNKSWKKMQFAGASQLVRVFQSILGYVFGSMFSTRAKKLIWLGIIVIILIMYYSSSRFILPHRHLKVPVHGGHKKTPLCLENALEPWYEKMEKADAVIKHIPSDSVDHQFLPFVGDGFIGLTIEGEKSELFILDHLKKSLVKVPFSTILEFRPMGEAPDRDETIVLDMKNGEIHRFTTFNGDDKRYCIVVEHTIFIHRHIPRLLVQEIKIDNFRPSPIHGRFDVKVPDDWTKEVVIPKGKKKMDGYTLSHGVVEGSDHSDKLVAIATSLFSKETKLNGHRSTRIKIETIVRSDDVSQESDAKAITDSDKRSLIESTWKDLKSRIYQDWISVLGKPLKRNHNKAWDSIWNLGIRIDSKDDPDTPSPLNVNITEYYLYSTIPFINISLPSSLESRTGACFYGSPTMHTPHFWVLPRDIDSLLSLTKHWNQTLFKYGCKKLLKTGVYGMQRAVVLSFSGLQYTKHGLELAVNPISLSSNVSLRHLPYNQNIIYIHIRIHPPDGLKTIEIFSDHTKGPKLYACGSACEHVVEVSSAPSVFLAKLTSPVTPILYVSTNKTDLQVIKRSSFMINAVKEVQADDQPRFAAHHFKLSAKFWAAVILAIVLFHVIVIKMIYTECGKDKGGKRTRGRAFVS